MQSKINNEEVFKRFPLLKEFANAIHESNEPYLNVEVIEREGKRWGVVGVTETGYICTSPFSEEEGETTVIPVSESKIIK